MAYELRYSDETVDQLRNLRAFERTSVLDQIERRLMVAPTTVSKTGIKKLRQPAPTQYRLRVGEYRVFYDVEGDVVSIIQILSKEESIRFLGDQHDIASPEQSQLPHRHGPGRRRRRGRDPS